MTAFEPIVPYMTSVEADVYFLQRLNTECWDASTVAEKDQALAQATLAIDNLNFEGIKTDLNQVNQFPRDDDAIVPQDILVAVCEEALALLEGVDARMEFENLSMVAQAYSSVKSTYDRSSLPGNVLAGITSTIAWGKLRAYLRDNKNLDISRGS